MYLVLVLSIYRWIYHTIIVASQSGSQSAFAFQMTDYYLCVFMWRTYHISPHIEHSEIRPWKLKSILHILHNQSYTYKILIWFWFCFLLFDCWLGPPLIVYRFAVHPWIKMIFCFFSNPFSRSIVFFLFHFRFFFVLL